MLTANELCCVRGNRRLFANLGFTLEPGRWLLVTGENGAGKTSLLRLLSGLSSSESGDILWQGETIRSLGGKYLRAMLYLGHLDALKEDLTARENLRISSALDGISLDKPQADDLLRRAGLSGYETLPARFLSLGQKRRVALARLLWSKASLWLLDEPFAALDNAASAWLHETLAAHLDKGGMAVITSHQQTSLNCGEGSMLRLGPDSV